MKQFFTRFWQKGILSTFLAGLFALLPIVITLGIMVWAGSLLKEGSAWKVSWGGHCPNWDFDLSPIQLWHPF
ncbi:MAG: hypothetical protein KDB27_27695 [Planctomycetales bacterium]|nr:hypothetical protein [Planctomycetales bacterium]